MSPSKGADGRQSDRLPGRVWECSGLGILVAGQVPQGREGWASERSRLKAEHQTSHSPQGSFPGAGDEVGRTGCGGRESGQHTTLGCEDIHSLNWTLKLRLRILSLPVLRSE